MARLSAGLVAFLLGKYLGVMQAEDGDPLAPVFHRVEIAWSRFRNLISLLFFVFFLIFVSILT